MFATVASIAANVSLSVRIALARGCFAIRCHGLTASEDEPGLRTAEEFVAADDDDIGSRGQGTGDIGLIGQVRVGFEQSAA